MIEVCGHLELEFGEEREEVDVSGQLVEVLEGDDMGDLVSRQHQDNVVPFEHRRRMNWSRTSKDILMPMSSRATWTGSTTQRDSGPYYVSRTPQTRLEEGLRVQTQFSTVIKGRLLYPSCGDHHSLPSNMQ